MINFLHTYLPDPILITLGPINIYWYSFLIILSIIFAFLISYKLVQKYKIEFEQVIDLGFYLIIFGIIGARLYHVLLEINYYFYYPLDIFKVWQGGMAIHGGIIAGMIVIYIYVKKKNQSFWFWADFLAPSMVLGQAIGRWGNYFNQELFGKPTDLAWGIPIEFQNRIQPYLDKKYFHPTFLYESISDIIIFSVLIFLHAKKTKLKQGNIFLIYLILYSIVRLSTEVIRIDPTPIFFNVKLPQLVSLLIIVISIILMNRNKITLAKTNQ